MNISIPDLTTTQIRRATATVVRHATDPSDVAGLLDMLGLTDTGQAGAVSRAASLSCGWSGTVHELSARTIARLAAPDPVSAAPAPKAGPKPRRPVAAPVATKPPSTADRPPTPGAALPDRLCGGCACPMVTPTQYRRDPAGYRERGVRSVAAKGLCRSCYTRCPPKPAAAHGPADRRCGECARPMVSRPAYDADPDQWRDRGYVAHAAHGLCRSCSAVAWKRLNATR